MLHRLLVCAGSGVLLWYLGKRHSEYAFGEELEQDACHGVYAVQDHL